ncbi:MAG: hypothetical protein VX727_05275 [Planctomycetota bacterium]|nr:hypothetical protein [Planctomycetota bacterium]
MHDPPDIDLPPTPPARPRFSVLAIIAVVLAFLPLCPPVNALGALLGVIAWRRIRESGGQLGGRRTSLTALFGGIAMSVVTLIGFQQLAEGMEQQQKQDMGVALDEFMHAMQDEAFDTALQSWSLRSTPVPRDELVSFSADLKQANGVFESVRIGSMQPVPGDSFLTPEVTAWIICRFDSGERNGSARFVLSPAPGRWTLVPLLVELRIDDGDGEELVLPQGITP